MTDSKARTAYFDELAATWDTAHGTQAEERIRAWCASVAGDVRSSGAFVVDLGCGTGISSHAWADTIAGRGTLVAVDRSLGMLRVARTGRDHPAIRWVCGDAHHLPLPGGTADVLVALHLWPHLDDQPAALREWRRVLKPGTRLWIVHLSSRAKINAVHRSGSEPIRHDRLPPVAELAQMVRESGFRIDRTEDSSVRYLLEAVSR